LRIVDGKEKKMNLATEEARLFFKLFLALLAYTNRQLRVVENVATVSDIHKLAKAGTASTMKIRDGLYSHSELLDRFIAENPENLTAEELDVIASWKHRVSGEFYLMRYLKKYAVFMPAKKSDHLYGVLGLFDPIEVVVHGQPLPVLLKATLLPFKGQIIYDGLVAPYTVLFGKGIRTDLDTTFRRLKQTEGIVEQLIGANGVPQIRTSLKAKTKPAPDWKPVIAEMVAQTDKMRRADTPTQSTTLGLLRATAHLAQLSFERPNLSVDDLKQVRRALSRLEGVLYDEEFE
jgi:hypothetical protein